MRKAAYLPRMPRKSYDFLHIDRVCDSKQDRPGLTERFAEMLWSRFRPPRDCYRPIKRLKKIKKSLLVKKSQKTSLKSIKKLVLEIPPLPHQQLCFICNSSAFMKNYVNTWPPSPQKFSKSKSMQEPSSAKVLEVLKQQS